MPWVNKGEWLVFLRHYLRDTLNNLLGVKFYRNLCEVIYEWPLILVLGPSRFLVPVGQRVAEDAVGSVSAASFLSRDKICGKINISSPARSSIDETETLVSTIEIKTEDLWGDSSDEGGQTKRGRGRPRKERQSLPGWLILIFYCDHLPFLAGILNFWLLGLGSYFRG